MSRVTDYKLERAQRATLNGPMPKVQCPGQRGDCEQLEVGKEGMPPLFVANQLTSKMC